MASAAQVVDLCNDSSNDENDTGVIDLSRKQRTAKFPIAPFAVSASSPILVDVDAESPPMRFDRSFKRTPRNKRKRVPEKDRKPAAKPRHETSDDIQVCQVKQAKREPIDRVFEIFPDVDRIHAQKLLFEHRNNVDQAVSILAESAYPKQKIAPAAASVASSSSLKVKRRKAPPKYDYLSISAFEPSEVYRQQAITRLLHEFPYLSQKGIQLWMTTHKGHYSLVRRHILNAIMGKDDSKQPTEDEEEKQYYLLTNTLATKNPNPKQIRRLGSQNVLKQRSYCRKRPDITEAILVEEVRHAKAQLEEWMEGMEQRLTRAKARRTCQALGTAMECSCCFDQVAMDEMVACRDEGHLFCVDCVRGYAENQIFGNGCLGTNKQTKEPATELLCCDSSGCQSPFQDAHLRKALPYKTLEKYNELQFQAVMEQAGLSQDLCTCPKCGFQADLPETQMIFECPVEDCQYVSCRKCGKDAHIPYKCDEVSKLKRQDEGRLKVEEAISQAKIRACPKCKTSFVKTDGCNKMTCRCGLKLCYLCRQPIPETNPYSHFCRTPHCDHKQCGCCTLFSNDKEDDERAMREAGVNAAEAYCEELLKGDESAEVEINVDQILGGTKSGNRQMRGPKNR